MKYILMVLIVLFVLFPQVGKSQNLQNKNSSNKSDNRAIHYSLKLTGGEIPGEGSFSYSLGQVFFSPQEGEDNYVVEGVQPLIFSIGPTEEVEFVFILEAYPNPVAEYFTIEASKYSSRSFSNQLFSGEKASLSPAHPEPVPPLNRNNDNLKIVEASKIVTSKNSHRSDFYPDSP